MRPPCEIIVTTVLPAFRSLVAKELIEDHSFTQVQAAQRLGITQAAISQYLSKKRGAEIIGRLTGIPEVVDTIHEIATNIAKDEITPFETMIQLCRLCDVFRHQSIACHLHQKTMEVPEDCNFCGE